MSTIYNDDEKRLGGAGESGPRTCNVIPFPGPRAARRQAAESRPRNAGAPLRRVLHKLKAAVLRLAFDPRQSVIQRKPESTSGSAANHSAYSQPAMQGQGGRQARKRICA